MPKTWSEYINWRSFSRQTLRITQANLKSRYRKTWAGFIWVILNPLIIYGAQSLIFKHILKINVERYYLFLLAGLMPWLFILQTLEMCTPIFQYSGPQLKLYPVHPVVFVVAQVIDNMINFLAGFVALYIVVWRLEGVNFAGLIYLPLALSVLVMGVFGLAWILSTMQVFFRDTKFIVGFALQVAYYLTPIFYPIDYVPAQYRDLMTMNPFYILLTPFRMCVYKFEPTAFFNALSRAAVLDILIYFVVAHLWKRKRNALYFSI